MMRPAVILFALLVLASTPARADEVESYRARLLASLWGEQEGPAPESVARLLWAMSLDPDVAASVLAQAGSEQRALTHELLSTLSWTEPEALEILPELHVVRTTSPPPGERPPTWADVRWVGLPLLRAIAPHDTGRDARRDLDLDRALEDMPHHRPSEVAGLVVLWEQWWADRGDDPTLYLDPARVPDVDAWWSQFTAEGDSAASVLAMAPRLYDDPLRRRLFLQRLSPDVHAYVAAEAIEVIKLYEPEFIALGVPDRRWNPDRGRMEGYRAEDLREMAMRILDHVTSHLASGADEDALITDWLLWWRTARAQARYYRDPTSAPTFDIWLGGLNAPVAEGGKPMATFLRDAYVAEGLRSLLLERLGPEQDQIVAELIEWLHKDQQAAQVDGFEFVHRRFPIRPRYQETGELMGIPWPAVKQLIRDMLETITNVEDLPEGGLSEDRLDAFWFDWWRFHASEPRWYRGAPPEDVQPPPFEIERARSN
jgi:hypothetical protein